MTITTGVLAVLIGTASAARPQEIQVAPTNPDFARYLYRAVSIRPLAMMAGENSYGAVPVPVDLSHLRQAPAPVPGARALAQAFPASYDLRVAGNKLTPVKNQNPWGTCWAFATYGSMESCLMPGESLDFAENNLVNLAGFDHGFNDGGHAFMSMAYLARWAGPVNEADDPYPNPGGSPGGLAVRKHVQQVRLVPAKTSATGNDGIKQAVTDHGALYVTYYHDNACYNSAYKAYYYAGSSAINHAVAIVGWDDSFDRNRFASVPAGDGAYIVRNSWGAGWGESGYFYVSYYDAKFAWEAMFAFLNAESTNVYKAVCQYDPLGWVTDLGAAGSTTLWGANILTANAAERLGAVGFYAVALNAAYEIYVYTGVSAGAPRSGTLAATKSGTCAYPGYRTITLDAAVPLASGQRFSIVIKLTTPGYNYPQATEYALAGYSSGATASPGQSYYSSAGSSWTDLTTWDATANFCIKGYLLADQAAPGGRGAVVFVR